MSVTTEFSLSHLVKSTIETYEGSDRGAEFVDTVMEQIAPEDEREALRQALLRLVHVFDNEVRRSALLKATKAPKEKRPRPVRSRSSGKTYASRKVQLQREVYWPAFLETSIPVEGGRKKLAFATAADLAFYVAQMRDHADQTRANAAKYERLRQLLIEKGKSEVRELDPEDWETVSP